MQLTDNDRVWAPEDSPDYLTVFPASRQRPTNRQDFLDLQVAMLRRLLAEANKGEKADANRRLDYLPQEALDFLPSKLADDPRFPAYLFNNPAVEGSPLQEWKAGVEEALQQPQMSDSEALELAQELSLESYLSRVL
jgi:hypothetical protein